MLGSDNDLILQHLAEITEIIAVARHPHDEVPVLLRIPLRFPQRLGMDHVELHIRKYGLIDTGVPRFGRGPASRSRL